MPYLCLDKSFKMLRLYSANHCEFSDPPDCQHGFVQGKSCLSHLTEFFEEVTTNIDEGSAGDVIYMDFKTFDKVPYGSLVWKVIWHGIQGKLANCTSLGQERLGWIRVRCRQMALTQLCNAVVNVGQRADFCAVHLNDYTVTSPKHIYFKELFKRQWDREQGLK